MTRIFFLTLLLSFQAYAADMKQVLQGIGIDGKACSVEVTREGNKLKNVVLRGATKVFEIIAEKEDGVGPSTYINSYGGEELFPFGDQKEVFGEFTYSQGLFSDSETFEIDTSDLNMNDLKGLKMVGVVQLNYEDGQVTEVKAGAKFKGLAIVTLASSQFICTK